MKRHLCRSPFIKFLVIGASVSLTFTASATSTFETVVSGQSTAAYTAVSQLEDMPSVQQNPIRRTRDVSDGVRNYELIELTNDLGEYEVRVLLKEEHWGAPDTQHTVLIGREIIAPPPAFSPEPDNDTSDEQTAPTPVSPRVSHWFIPSRYETHDPIEFYQKSDDPWPTAQEIIRQHIEAKNRWLPWIVIEIAMSAVPFSYTHQQEVFRQIQLEQLDLLDLEIRANHLQTNNPHDPFLPIARELVAEGWTAILNRLHDEGIRKVWLYGFGDVALGAISMKVWKVAERVIGAAATKAAVTRVGRALQISYEKILQVTKGRAARALELSRQSRQWATAASARAVVVKLSLRRQIAHAVGFMQQRSILVRGVLKGLRAVLTTARNGIGEWRYLAQSQAIQVAVETAARTEDLFDLTHPIVLGKKVLTDQEFWQNIAYMANDSFWMTGVAALPKTSLGKRFVICGAIGLVDSVALSWLIKGQPDPKRTALDTSWEVLVGNTQTLFDVAVFKHFSALAIKNKNPKLKLVGYLVTMVDQAMGYYGYAKVTSMFGSKPQDVSSAASSTASPANSIPTPEIIPDLGNSQIIQPPLLPPSQDDLAMIAPQIRLIPILAP